MQESSKVVHIRGGEPTIVHGMNPDAIAMLDRLLKKAQKGEIVSFAYASVAPNGHVKFNYEWGTHAFGLVSGVAFLAQALNDEAIASCRDSPDDIEPDGAA